jgi:hypothetical protein
MNGPSTHPASEVLLALANEALAPTERAHVASHVSSCTICARGVAAFAEIGRLARDDAPPPFAMARARRRLLDALVEERRAAVSMWRPRTVMVAMLVATLGGAAFAAVSTSRLGWFTGADAEAFSRRRSSTTTAEAATTEALQTPVAVPLSGPEADVSLAPTVAPDVDQAIDQAIGRALRAPVSSRDEPARLEPSRVRPSTSVRAPEPKSRRVALAPGGRSADAVLTAMRAELVLAPPGDARFVDLGDLAALAGDPRVALEAYTRGLAGSRAAEADQRLDRLVADGTLSEEDVLGAIAKEPAAQESAEGMKRRCATELRHRGDRQAVALCQRFGEQFPQHPAVRRLALAAGRTAEFRLDDPTLAVLEYSRAILVSDIAGLASTEALLARARAQAKLGAMNAARADLGLYLHVHPEALHRDDVRALATLVGLDPETLPTRD